MTSPFAPPPGPPTLPRPLPPLDQWEGPVRGVPLSGDRPLRWGILATGRIAHLFAQDLSLLDDHVVAAVGSRRLDTAEAFAARFGGTPYGSYEALCDDPGVDVVYVATPHTLHLPSTLTALRAGKPVLCEKPFALNAAEAEEMVAEARSRGLFLMEAMWMRCIPAVRRLQQLLVTGALGTVRQVRADLGFVADRPADDRLFDPVLGGGAVLDVGVYPVTFATLVLGLPDRVAGLATLAPTGIDLDASVSLGYPGGALASLSVSLTAATPRSATVATDLGRIDVPAPFHHPAGFTWTSGGHTEHVTEPLVGGGLAHEAMEVARCLRRGETESPLVPLDDTVALVGLMDRVRAVLGVRYPAETGPEQ